MYLILRYSHENKCMNMHIGNNLQYITLSVTALYVEALPWFPVLLFLDATKINEVNNVVKQDEYSSKRSKICSLIKTCIYFSYCSSIIKGIKCITSGTESTQQKKIARKKNFFFLERTR